jgi:ankyrin repeat protein
MWPGVARAHDTLIAAAERGETVIVRRLLVEGVSVNARDGRGRTALLAAVQRNQIEVARLLVNEGADVNARDFAQDTPFLVAGADGRAESRGSEGAAHHQHRQESRESSRLDRTHGSGRPR